MAVAKAGQVRSQNEIPAGLFESLNLRGINFDGKKIADICSGIGTFTRKLKLRKADVIGVEPSEDLLEKAKEISRARFEHIPFVNGTAEHTGLESSSYDLVTVYKAWHGFNRELALKEIKRILMPMGKLIVSDAEFLRGNEAVEAAIKACESFYGKTLWPAGSKAKSGQLINSFPVKWFAEWKKNGFELRDFYKLDYSVTFSNEMLLNEVLASYNAPAENTKEISLALTQDLDNQFGSSASHAVPYASYVCILDSY